MCESSPRERQADVSEENTVRVRLYSDGTLIDPSTGKPYESDETTDWERLRNMTEEEIEANALSDPDNPPLTEEELSRMRRVVDARRVRKKLKMTQVQFAETFEIPLGTLRDWEQKGTFITQNQAAASYLRVIEQNPGSGHRGAGGLPAGLECRCRGERRSDRRSSRPESSRAARLLLPASTLRSTPLQNQPTMAGTKGVPAISDSAVPDRGR